MVVDETTEEFENGLIDPKTIELDAKFREALDGRKSVKGSLEIIWESMNYNFGKIRTRQHANTQGIQKMVFEQKVTDARIVDVAIKQGEFKPRVEEHMKQRKEEKIKNEATWKVITKFLGGMGILITVTLALLQLMTIAGGI